LTWWRVPRAPASTTPSSASCTPKTTASGKAPFSHRIIGTTTNNWSEHAEDALQGQQPPVSKIDIQALEDGQIDWAKYQPN